MRNEEERKLYHKEYGYWHNLKKYGISLGDYNQILEKQNGGCAICGKKSSGAFSVSGVEKRMFVDHNHETGKIRGLLCFDCNIAIGHIHDDREIALKIVDYLK